jgi:four helix bundle protein
VREDRASIRRLTAHRGTAAARGTSLGANLQEAKSASSRRDLIARDFIALREARETQYWLRLLIATDPATDQTTIALEHEAAEFVAMLTAGIRRLKASSP